MVQECDALRMPVSQPIVEIVIGALLFHPDDLEGLTHKRSLSLFEKSDMPDDGTYTATIKKAILFSLVVKLIASGSSFRQATIQAQIVREETGLVCYSGISELLVSNFVRVVCAVGFQCLSDILATTHGFSLALDCATLQGMSYLDVRCRFVVLGKLYNFHLMAVPLYDRHTAKNLFESLQTFLTAIIPTWSGLLVGISTDGENTMTGRIKGLATRIAAATTGQKIIRVWCGLHQLDLVMKACFETALDENFMSFLTGLIGHLRRQQNFIKTIRSECPYLAETRWTSVTKCANWLTGNVLAIQEHLDEKNPHNRPPTQWWVFLFAVQAFAAESSKIFIALQGRASLLSEQRVMLRKLIETFKRMTHMEGPIPCSDIAKMTGKQFESNGEYVLEHFHALAFLQSLDIWVLEALESLDPDTKLQLVVAVAKLFVNGASGISGITAERDAANAAYDDTPLVLPHQLLSIGMPEFAQIIKQHTPRLSKTLDATEIHQISKEFVKLQRCCEREDELGKVIRAADDNYTSFDQAWSVVGAEFPALMQFCGDLASTFPNTSTVESDFSIMGWEKDTYRRSLSNFL